MIKLDDEITELGNAIIVHARKERQLGRLEGTYHTKEYEPKPKYTVVVEPLKTAMTPKLPPDPENLKPEN